MKAKLVKTLTVLAALGFVAGNAQANTMTFDDDWNNWNNDDSLNEATKNRDTIGQPHVLQMAVTWNGGTGYLEQVDIILGADDRVVFDSLFINNEIGESDGAWASWDYFVNTGGDFIDHPNFGIIGDAPDQGLYTVRDAYGYTLATGEHTRANNPNGIGEDYLFDRNAAIFGVQTGLTISYDFRSVAIDVSDGFFMAYSPWCANDVMGAGYTPSDAIPEPATMLLFGVGLAGLASFGRKKAKKRA
jgi:hypothetical protein